MVPGRHGAVDVSVLAAPPTCRQLSLCCPFPGKGEIPFSWEFPLFLARRACAGTARSPLTSCRPCVEVSFPDPALGRWMGPSSISRKKAGLASGTLFPRKLPRALPDHRGVPMGSLLSMLAGPGRAVLVHTCLWFLGKMKPPTTGTGWELTSKLRLA